MDIIGFPYKANKTAYFSSKKVAFSFRLLWEILTFLFQFHPFLLYTRKIYTQSPFLTCDIFSCRSRISGFIKSSSYMVSSETAHFPRCSKTNNNAGIFLRFLDKQRAMDPLYCTNFQACSYNITGFLMIKKI